MSSTRTPSIQIAGQVDAELLSSVLSRAQSRLATGQLSAQTHKHISESSFRVFSDTRTSATLPDEAVEHLRTMCQLWDVKLAPRDITSHRPFVGPMIVAVKKLMVPVLQFIFRDFIRQQRAFNASAIKAFGYLAGERSSQ